MPAALLEPSRAAVQGDLPDLTEGVIARILDPLFPASTNLCQNLKKKERVFFFNTSSAFQCVYHRFQVYCHTLSNNLDKFPKELGGKLGIYQWIFKFQEDMELETEMT